MELIVLYFAMDKLQVVKLSQWKVFMEMKIYKGLFPEL